MAEAQRRIKIRRDAKDKIAQVADQRENVLLVHYSCESFYDRPGGASPRITSLAVRHLASGQTESFSIHQVAEREKKLSANEIDQNYDAFEKKMLKEFYDFAGRHAGHTWIHWNMRDANYGFPALEHRYKVLGGSNPSKIHDSHLLDLARAIVDIYSSNYAQHPRFATLMGLNAISDLNFLTGAEEAAAFDQKEYVKLHQSTLRKVDVLASLFDRVSHGTLKTNATIKDIYGGYFAYALFLIGSHWLGVLLTFIGTIASILGLFLYFADKATKG